MRTPRKCPASACHSRNCSHPVRLRSLCRMVVSVLDRCRSIVAFFLYCQAPTGQREKEKEPVEAWFLAMGGTPALRFPGLHSGCAVSTTHNFAILRYDIPLGCRRGACCGVVLHGGEQTLAVPTVGSVQPSVQQLAVGSVQPSVCRRLRKAACTIPTRLLNYYQGFRGS